MENTRLKEDTERTMTTRELAEALKVEPRTIQRVANAILDPTTVLTRVVNGGQSKVFNEAQATAIKLELQRHHNIADRTAIDQIGNDLEGELLVQKAMAYQQQKIELLQSQVNTMTPKAVAYDEYVDRGKFCNLRDAANYLRVTQTEFMDLLRSRYIYKNSVGEYRCYAEYAGYFALRPFGRGKDRTGHQLMVTVAGLTHFGRVLGEMHEERRKEIVDGGMEAAEKIIGSMRDGCPIQIGCISHRELAGAGRAENHTC